MFSGGGLRLSALLTCSLAGVTDNWEVRWSHALSSSATFMAVTMN
jgi:hypothetical protein